MKSAGSSSVFPALLAGIVSFYFFGSMIYSIGLGVGAYLFVHIGAALPDIDHHSSKPFRYLRSLMGVSFGAIGLFIISKLVGDFIINGWNSTVEIVDVSEFGSSILAYNFGRAVGALVILIPILLYSAIGLGKWIVESLRPKHRGPTHSLLFGVITSVLLGLVVTWGSSSFFSPDRAIGLGTIIAVANHIGVLDHLSVDGLI